MEIAQANIDAKRKIIRLWTQIQNTGCRNFKARLNQSHFQSKPRPYINSTVLQQVQRFSSWTSVLYWWSTLGHTHYHQRPLLPHKSSLWNTHCNCAERTHHYNFSGNQLHIQTWLTSHLRGKTHQKSCLDWVTSLDTGTWSWGPLSSRSNNTKIHIYIKRLQLVTST